MPPPDNMAPHTLQPGPPPDPNAPQGHGWAEAPQAGSGHAGNGRGGPDEPGVQPRRIDSLLRCFLYMAQQLGRPVAEAELYAMLAKRLPKTTIVSIGHRSTLTPLHKRHLEMSPEGDHFTLRDTAKADAAE